MLGSVGEPISPAAWEWYYKVVGDSKCSVVDTYWQTETGTSGFVLSFVLYCFTFVPCRWYYLVTSAWRDADEAWLVHASIARHRACPP